MAENKGFEPSNGLPRYTLSKRAPSTARPILRTIQSSKFIKKRRKGLYGGLMASALAEKVAENLGTLVVQKAAVNGEVVVEFSALIKGKTQ